MKNIILNIKTVKLKAGFTKCYPIEYAEPVVAVNPDAVKKLAQMLLRKNKCQWSLPIEYKESNGGVVVRHKEYRARKKRK